MPTRLPACDPCKNSKLACDHTRPVCSRCHDRKHPESCIYRAKPFKRKRSTIEQSSNRQQSQHDVTEVISQEPTTLGMSRKYPNPGYLGTSSHTAIFHHLPIDANSDSVASTPISSLHSNSQPQISMDDIDVSFGAQLLEKIHRCVPAKLYVTFVEMWLSSGVNMALAGPLTQSCVRAFEEVFEGFGGNPNAATLRSRSLSINSSQASSSTSSPTSQLSTFDEFCATYCHPKVRWEAIGLFFTAVSRATIDLAQFSTLYKTKQKRQNVQRLAMRFADDCLNIALSLDNMNDLLLILQYENFVNHSHVDGDQSYQSWRRLGDVISSIFALGYHEQIQPVPMFLKDLRQAAVESAYSADKNVSIFLGRPPRLLQKHCRLSFGTAIGDTGLKDILPHNDLDWMVQKPFDYHQETHWSFRCAFWKEQALDILHDKVLDHSLKRAEDIQAQAEADWQALPQYFRLEKSLKLYSRSPIERDFMVSARLNHLHILLLLRLALLQRLLDPDPRLISIAAEMLNLTTEAALVRNELANSGTGLVWKVAYYGLPAAGIICLALLQQQSAGSDLGLNTMKVFQDLSVLVAQVETGALVDADDPNYALLSGATQTIKTLLNRVFSGTLSGKPSNAMASGAMSTTTPATGEDAWVPWTNHDIWDFEMEFWNNLAEHPVLAGSAEEMSYFP